MTNTYRIQAEVIVEAKSKADAEKLVENVQEATLTVVESTCIEPAEEVVANNNADPEPWSLAP